MSTRWGQWTDSSKRRLGEKEIDTSTYRDGGFEGDDGGDDDDDALDGVSDGVRDGVDPSKG